ncbi:uncharacterized protein Z518_04343 [Rhinocladiella mackenziei CBS 650.93]|uniref:Uncharacterized protein n=1 Tax=Rhinocladiella mackenziei CBS 650.93 TaxID=1442369 RepID=A0A0D2FW30_9EURO|nr:uncharacterized protein Z518_04343 [Rhinocladiella mackenziei CBS 650.93]KIX06367.1 hypothetical protein Z518_04343 [Rhinocladiella mackenziei CBS 650.93]
MAPTPPSELQILHSYLLQPSPLSCILPWPAFQVLAPTSTRQNPNLRRLYRDLEFRRDITIDDVRRRIDDECRQSAVLVGRLGKAVRREEGLKTERKRKRGTDYEDDDDDVNTSDDDDDYDNDEAEAQREIKLDTHLHGQAGNTLSTKIRSTNHTSSSLLSAMQIATSDLESDITSLEAEIESIHRECEERVGALSDLRYGRFAGRSSSDLGSSTGAEGLGHGNRNSDAENGVESEVVRALEELRDKLNGGREGWTPGGDRGDGGTGESQSRSTGSMG